MIKKLDFEVKEFSQLKKPPKTIYTKGDVKLLNRKKVSIVGTRRPISYTKEMTLKIAREFSSIGYVIVSGAAMGVDALAHKASIPNTIAVMANSLDIHYPKINDKLINQMEKDALVISEYTVSTKATKYSFVIRNRLVVALGEILIITEADLNSGTLRSAEIAKELSIPIFVLPHRLSDSKGTHKLVEDGDATIITDIDKFVANYGEKLNYKIGNEFDDFFEKHPSLQEALDKYGDKLYEYELDGLIQIKNLRVYPCKK